jgi:rhodanese-related sulfurtransferase
MDKMGKIFKRGILQVLIIIAAGVIIGLAVNNLRQDKVETPQKSDIQAGQSSSQITPNSVQITKISVWEGFKAFRSGSAMFIDARHPADFDAGHIPKAVNIPPEKNFSMDSKDQKAASKLIIVYCQSRDCPLADELAKKIAQDGFTNIKVMPEGWEAWNESGYPVESGR